MDDAIVGTGASRQSDRGSPRSRSSRSRETSELSYDSLPSHLLMLWPDFLPPSLPLLLSSEQSSRPQRGDPCLCCLLDTTAVQLMTPLLFASLCVYHSPTHSLTAVTNRLDAVASGALGLSRSRLVKMIAAGEVTVNGAVSTSGSTSIRVSRHEQ